MKGAGTIGWMIGAAMIGIVSLAGCATHRFVRERVAEVDSRVTAADTRLADHDAKLAAHDARLEGLDRTTREALDRAQAAGKLAEGKFLYTVVLSDDSVKFGVARTELSADAQAKLSAFVDRLKADNHNVYVEIQGHTDDSGPKAGNYALGTARAETVRLFLNKQGVALNRMSTISYGPDSPLQPNRTRTGRLANRSVVLVVLS